MLRFLDLLLDLSTLVRSDVRLANSVITPVRDHAFLEWEEVEPACGVG